MPRHADMSNELRSLWRKTRKALEDLWVISLDTLDDMWSWAKENPDQARVAFLAILAIVSSGDLTKIWDVISPFL